MRKRERRVAAAPDATPGEPPIDDLAPPEPLTMIAGYRVVRRLGSSGRADVYLGHAARERPGAAAPDATPPDAAPAATSVALKVFRPDADAASIELELRALSETPAGRFPELIDLATLPDGRACLVLEWLAGGGLGQHLRERDRLRPGEAVTILAPVVAAVAGLHAAGLVHEGLGLSSIIFDARGRPVLTALGGLRELPPQRARGRADGASRRDLIRDDHARLAMLVRSVFDHLDPAEPAVRPAEDLIAWFDAAASEVPARPCLEELERRLFEWSRAAPVRLVPAEGVDAGAGGAVLTPGVARAGTAWSAVGAAMPPGVQGGAVAAASARREGISQGSAAPSHDRRQARPMRWLGTIRPPTRIVAAVVRTLDGFPLEGLRARLRERLRGKRRPLLVAGVVSAAVIVFALTLLPVRAGSSTAGTSRQGSPTTGATSAGATTPTKPVRSAAEAGALEGDDPARAAAALLGGRARCLSAASVVCLEGVDQAGSATMAADSYNVRATQQGGGRPEAVDYAAYAASVVERTGNSALVALTPPGDGVAEAGTSVSALLVKGESGWRLREIFDY